MLAGGGDRVDRPIDLSPPPWELSWAVPLPLLFSSAFQPLDVQRVSLADCVPEFRQHTVNVDQRIADLPKQLAVTAEDVLRRVIHQTCRHGIEVDVDDEATERLRRLHELGFVPALPARSA